MIDYESLKEATILVSRLEALIAEKSAPLQAQIDEIQKQLDDAVRADRGRLDTAKNLLEQIRLEVSEELTTATRKRLADLGRGVKSEPIEMPQWLSVTNRTKITVTDISLVPAELLQLDEKAALKQKTEIPGVQRELVLGLRVSAAQLTKETKSQ